MSKRNNYDFLYDVLWGFVIFIMIFTTLFIAFLITATITEIIRDNSLRQYQSITVFDNSGKILEHWTGDLSVSHKRGATLITTSSDGVIEITGGIVIAK